MFNLTIIVMVVHCTISISYKALISNDNFSVFYTAVDWVTPNSELAAG